MKKAGIYLQSILYIVAGINHFLKPAIYMSIMPGWLPRPRELVYTSGAIEIILGILFLIPKTRSLAAWGIIILLVAVFPANIQMALNYIKIHHPSTWIAILRLPLQFLLIWFAWIYTRRHSQPA